jgi:O-antigen/teichoic acid export membrane protein
MNKLQNKKRILVNSIVVTGANIFENLVFFLLNILVARFLSIAHYGEYSTAIGFSTFFLTFCDIGINQTLFRSVTVDAKKIRHDAGSTIILKGVLSVTTYSALVIALHFTNFSASTIILTVIFGLVRLFSDYLKTLLDLFDARERFLFSAISKSLFSILVLFFSLVVLALAKDYYWLFISRLCVTLFFSVGIAALVLHGIGKGPRFSAKHSYRFFRSSLPFGISSVLTNFYQRMNIIILSIMHGTHLSGIFSNAYMFFTTLFIIPGGFSRALLPFLYRHDRHANRLTFQYAFDIYTKYMTIFGYYLALMIFIFCSQAITIIFGEKYSESIPVLRIVSLNIPFLFSMAGTIITALDKQKSKTIIETIAVPISVAANLILIRLFKAEGAAFASVITYGSIFAGYHFYLHLSGLLDIRSAITVNIRLIIISTVSFFAWDHFLSGNWFILNFFIITGLFFSLVTLLMIRRTDIGLIRNLFINGTKKKKKK